MNTEKKIAKIFSFTGYKFKNENLINEALTHCSLEKNNNEILEFLGDRVLGLVLAEMLIKNFPLEKEGDIAVRYSNLSSSIVLSDIAKKVGLGRLIEMSQSEENTGGRDNPSILADACEALLGAIYLEAGLEPAKDFIHKYWQDFMNKNIEPPKDAKSALQEWTQSRGYGLPKYEVVDRSGPDHNPLFIVNLKIGSLEVVVAEGNSKKVAEQNAAKIMLEKISKI
ncbi:MAG: ribonuclease III [Alphaproteobacteria bacterium]